MTSADRPPRPDFDPVGTAVLGCGRVSDAHLEAICAGNGYGRLEAVIDAERARAEASARRFGAPRVFRSLAQALEVPSIEAVVVCLPNHRHEASTIAALEARRHVLVEKPMADDVGQALRMSRAADAAGRVLAVGQSRRHTKAVRYLADHLHSFGRLRSLQDSFCIRWNGPQTPWWRERTREQGLVLSLIAPHALDFVQLVMGGADPIRIHAESVRHRDGWLADDEAMLLLSYPERRLASVHLSYNQQPPFDRAVLLFDDAVVQLEDRFVLSVNGKRVVEPDAGEVAAQSRPALQFVWQFEEFARAVRGRPSRSVMHQEGVRLIRIIDAVKRAAMTGEVVRLDEGVLDPPSGGP